MNAMALIAPGAFLWITYQLQAAATARMALRLPVTSGRDSFALILAFLTAISYAQLARLYPEADSAAAITLRRKRSGSREIAHYNGRDWPRSSPLAAHAVLLGLSRHHDGFHGYPDRII